jgi:hypothetical protein
MHLGERGKNLDKVDYWMPYPLMIDGPNCGKTYDLLANGGVWYIAVPISSRAD